MECEFKINGFNLLRERDMCGILGFVLIILSYIYIYIYIKWDWCGSLKGEEIKNKKIKK